MQFDADRQQPSAGGTVSLYANDEKIDRTVPVRFSGYAEMDVGRDNGLPGRSCRRANHPTPSPAP